MSKIDEECCHFVIAKERDEDFIAFLYDVAVPFSTRVTCKNGGLYHYFVQIPEDMEEIDCTRKKTAEEMRLYCSENPMSYLKTNYLFH
jgi:hypothetical protein